MAKRRDKRMHLINICNNYNAEFSADEDVDHKGLVRAISELRTQGENFKKVNSYNKKISNDIVEFLM